ncbi:glycosyltransferase family 1 protein [Actinotalea sp. Marseille-Q4924]|uniref:rhamnosyltransferase WsaF family glycosyltransferase n=1 Tax=Actinotalea sp. Marseille-Q4924 TaxID=2866571 RepID=UPI001CE45FFB|nr:glycosyltransferase family 1 protein [Actinotalea sp. Marseille-Q4924]
MLVRYEDAASVDWTQDPAWRATPRAVVSEKLSTAWLMHPPGESSGGHQNIFRFIKFLEDAGHRATVYLYHSAAHDIDAPYLREIIRRSSSYPDVDARFVAYDKQQVAQDTDIILATGWETAYPAFLDPSTARRAYFVQDFEPAFYPVGTEHTLAENTYRFGFHGITAGRWLAAKLARDYGMPTAHFDFAADTSTYHLTNRDRRQDVFFYARPVTTRRGFELGVLTLEHLARLRPDLTIHLAGWDVSSYRLSFPHVDHGAMPVSQLNDLYNRCGVGLVLSLTNLSLMPLELLAAGVIPVMNEGENNRLVTDNPFIEYAQASPAALARKMAEVLDRQDLAEHSAAASQSVVGSGWGASGRQFLDALEAVARG